MITIGAESASALAALMPQATLSSDGRFRLETRREPALTDDALMTRPYWHLGGRRQQDRVLAPAARNPEMARCVGAEDELPPACAEPGRGGDQDEQRWDSQGGA